MKVFVPFTKTKEAAKRKLISGNGWSWARVRGVGDSLGYGGGRGQSTGLVSACKVVIIVGVVGVGVGVREAGARGGGRHEGVDKWAVKGVFRAEVRDVFLLKPGMSGEINFLRCTPQRTAACGTLRPFMTELEVSLSSSWCGSHTLGK